MADGGRQDVLGRKAQAAQRAFEARGMSPAKALRRALARTADILWDLALVCNDVQMEALDQDGVVSRLTDGNMLILLDGPDGVIGLAQMDREIVTGLVEIQTIQHVTTVEVDDRPLTTTDAALMSPMLDGTLKRFPQFLEDHPMRPQLLGYRFGAMVEDVRSVGMVLDAASYRTFHATIDLAVGRRRGKLSFFLPNRVIERSESEDAVAEAPGPHEAVMMRLPASLNCVLGTVTLTLAKAQALKAGDVLPLADGAQDNVEMYAARGALVASGSLGQQSGMRALRVTWPKGAGTTAATASGAGMGLPEIDDAAAAMSLEAPEMDFGMDGGMDMSETPDFGAEADPMADFAMGGDAEAGDEAMPDLPAMDFDMSELEFDPAEPGEGGEGDGGFGAAEIDIDFD